MNLTQILFQEPIPLYTVISKEKHKNPNCYFIDEPQFESFQSGDFIADVSKGGSVNCEYIRFCAHGNGTHTECFGHVSKQKYSIQNIKIPFLMPAQVIDYTFNIHSNKAQAISIGHFVNIHRVSAIILRMNSELEDLYRLSNKFSGTNPPYIDKYTIEYLKIQGVHHILTDLPSIDPENDNGKLEAHLTFWGMKDRESLPLYPNDTVTELCYIPYSVQSGEIYMLHIGLSPFEADAVPSMPVLFPIKKP